jgi:hypothetical protein
VALLIPCHRVIHQKGDLGGYHWGLTRKRAIYAWEAARVSYGRHWCHAMEQLTPKQSSD